MASAAARRAWMLSNGGTASLTWTKVSSLRLSSMRVIESSWRKSAMSCARVVYIMSMSPLSSAAARAAPSVMTRNSMLSRYGSSSPFSAVRQ